MHDIDGRDARETATPPAEECEVILHLRTPSLNAVITLAGFLIICCNEGLPSLVTDRLFPRRLSLSVRGGDFRTSWEMPSLPLFSSPCHRDDVSSVLEHEDELDFFRFALAMGSAIYTNFLILSSKESCLLLQGCHP